MRSFVLFAFLAAVNSAAAETPDIVAIVDIPEAFRLIRTANEVYVFPVALIKKRVPNDGSSITPRGNYSHLRRLDAPASRKLQELLGKESNWLHANDSTISTDTPSKSVGFIFREGRDELVLLHSLGARLQGTFNTQGVGGSLEFDKADPQLDKWMKEFAKPELGIK